MERHTREIIDTWRAGHDDLSLPEASRIVKQLATDDQLREWYRGVTQCDEAITEAMLDVTPPRDFADRLLAMLQSLPADSLPGDSSMPAPTIQPVERSHRRKKATLMAVSLATAAAVVLIAIGVIWNLGTSHVTPEQVVRWAQHWQPDGQQWQNYPPVEPIAYPFSSFARTDPGRWQVIRTELDRQTVVFDLSREQPTYLFVTRLPQSSASFATRPPTRPLTETGGVSVAVWREGDYLYTFVVHGSKQLYDESIRSTPPTLAASCHGRSTFPKTGCSWPLRADV